MLTLFFCYLWYLPIMEINYLINDLQGYISRIGKHYSVPYLDDYVQEVLLILFEKGNDFIRELQSQNKLKNYVYKISVLLLYSKEGAYYKKYIYPNNAFVRLNGIERVDNKSFKEERLKDLINSLKGNDKILLEQLVKCRGNKQSLSNKSKISYSTLHLMIKKLGEKICTEWTIEDFYE